MDILFVHNGRTCDAHIFIESEHPRGETGRFEATGSPGATPTPGKYGTNKRANIAEATRVANESGLAVTHWPKPGNRGAAWAGNGQIQINTSHPYWKDPVGNQKAQHASRFMSSENPDHIIHHEIGHTLHPDAPDNWFGGNFSGHKETAEKQVSRYAATNPKEFVAEVYAGLKGGKEYPEEVMRLFREYGRKREF